MPIPVSKKCFLLFVFDFLSIFYRRLIFDAIKNDFIISVSAIQYSWIHTLKICLSSTDFPLKFQILERSILFFFFFFFRIFNRDKLIVIKK
ncbi:hypothetical protein Hanom_Chr00s005652g01729741 [Helianthus anomalus]